MPFYLRGSSCAVLLLLGSTAAVSLPAVVNRNGGSWTLSNGYVEATLSVTTEGAAVTSLKGDFDGLSQYGDNLLSAGGFSLQCSVAERGASNAAPVVTVTSNSSHYAAIKVSGVRSGPASEIWQMSLRQSNRAVELNTTGTVSNTTQSRSMLVYHTLQTTPLSVYGFYPDAGVVQMMNADPNHSAMASKHPLRRAYMLGGINPNDNGGPPHDRLNAT